MKIKLMALFIMGFLSTTAWACSCQKTEDVRSSLLSEAEGVEESSIIVSDLKEKIHIIFVIPNLIKASVADSARACDLGRRFKGVMSSASSYKLSCNLP